MAISTAERLRQEGRQEGRIEGHKEGHKEGGAKTVRKLVFNAKKQGLPEALIAQIVNLDITLVHKILNNEPVEIPLHLLDSDDA